MFEFAFVCCVPLTTTTCLRVSVLPHGGPEWAWTPPWGRSAQAGHRRYVGAVSPLVGLADPPTYRRYVRCCVAVSFPRKRYP